MIRPRPFETPERPAGATPAAAVLAILLMLAAFASPVLADQREEALEVLQRTRAVLDDIRELVLVSESEQARRIRLEAERRQEAAVTLFGNERYRAAATMSLKARDAARQAERIARESHSFQTRAQQYLDRLQESHQNLTLRARETENETALRFLQEAERAYFRAREQYNQTRYEAAFTLLGTAERQLQRAARVLFESGDGDRLRQELEHTAELIDRAGEMIGMDTDPALFDQLDQAEQMLEDAERALAAGEPLRALRLGRLAREKVQRVMGRVREDPDADMVAAQIAGFDRSQAVLVERVADVGNDEAAGFLRRARELREQAQSALDGGNGRLALRKIRSALSLQHRAEEHLR